MSLETLKGIAKIGEFEVERSVGKSTSVWPPLLIDDSENIIAFKLQNGPIHEKGANGCQVDTLIEAAKLIIEGLNKTFPCRENSLAITKLDEALHWLDARRRDREKRGVEGFNLV